MRIATNSTSEAPWTSEVLSLVVPGDVPWYGPVTARDLAAAAVARLCSFVSGYTPKGFSSTR